MVGKGLGVATQGKEIHFKARHNMECQGKEMHGVVRKGITWQGKVRKDNAHKEMQDNETKGNARHGKENHGMERKGMAWHGKSRQGK
jgi:hypothetical protein